MQILKDALEISALHIRLTVKSRHLISSDAYLFKGAIFLLVAISRAIETKPNPGFL